jgi:hypothetical protein
MKKLIITIIALQIIAFGVQAQDSAISDLFDKYQDDERFTKVSVSSRMFELFTEFDPEDPDAKELTEAMSKLKGLKILAADSISGGGKLYREARSDVQKSNFEELMSVRDGDQDVLFMIKEEGDIITEMLMLVGGQQEFVAMSLYGEIDLKTISKLSRGMKINGMKYLENIEEQEKNGKE